VNKEYAKCLHCGSQEVIKTGRLYGTMKGTWRQKYKCKKCGHKFNGVRKFPATPAPFVYKSKPIPQQNWGAYTKAQNAHKQGLMDIMSEMLSFIEIRQPERAGRPSTDLKDVCFALALKTFTGLSSRRLHSELNVARQLGYISSTMHFTNVMRYLGAAEMSLLLRALLKLSALPVKQMSSGMFSVDSTGFSTSQFSRWVDHRYDKELVKREWVKCHAMIENTSNVVVSAKITDGYAADSPRFERLVCEASKTFRIREVCADMAYNSRKNLEIVSRIGGQAFIPFRSISTDKWRGSLIWQKMYRYFKSSPQDFYEHYHQRSNVESTFAMVKQKFGSSLRARNFTGQQNEVMLRLICHNCCCLLHEYFELNVEKYFTTQTPKIVIRRT